MSINTQPSPGKLFTSPTESNVSIPAETTRGAMPEPVLDHSSPPILTNDEKIDSNSSDSSSSNSSSSNNSSQATVTINTRRRRNNRPEFLGDDDE